MKKITEEQALIIVEEIGEFTLMEYEQYGLVTVETLDGKEYAIALDSDEAYAAATIYIKDTIWAFNADFIIAHSGVLDYDNASNTIVSAIQELCEGGNYAMMRLIDDIDEFVEDAIAADGRGHFISGYDGVEIELDDDIFLYRVN